MRQETIVKGYDQFYQLTKSTEITYSNVLLKLGVQAANANFPILKMFSQGFSMLNNSQIQRYLNETGNQDIRSAMKRLRDDLYGDNVKAEIEGALTLLKRGRDTFFSAILAELNSPLNPVLSSDGLINFLTQNIGFESPFVPQIKDNFEKAFFSATLIALCYKILNDNQKFESAFNDMRYFFYNRLFSCLGYDSKSTLNDALRTVNRGESIHIHISSMNRDPEELYKAMQQDEKQFIELCNAVFGKNLAPTIPATYIKDRCEIGGGMPRVYVLRLYTDWNVPRLGTFNI
jgi:hypothetical protein